jgi:integrase
VYTVRMLVDEYKAARTDIKPATLIHLTQASRALIEIFGADHPVAAITEADAENFYRKLLDKKLAFNTARRRTGRAKQYFAYAVRKRIIPSNPFNGVKTSTYGNPKRQVYVSVETIQAVLDACPTAEWRLIVALARFGGLRTPSEHLRLTLGDIHWDRDRFTVHSEKTEHIEGKDVRHVPIFPELKPYLEDAFAMAQPGQVHLITRNRCDDGAKDGKKANWRTTFLKIIARAGVKPWVKLFQNLRSSCQTDLANRFPGHVVCEWMGNSEAVAQEHYLQVTDEHFKLATDPKTGSLSGSHWSGLGGTGRNTGQSDPRGKPENSGAVHSGLVLSSCTSGPGGTRTRTPCGTGF